MDINDSERKTLFTKIVTMIQRIHHHERKFSEAFEYDPETSSAKKYATKYQIRRESKNANRLRRMSIRKK